MSYLEHLSLDNITSILLPALRHRVLLNFEGEAERIETDKILTEIMSDIPESTE